MPSCRSHFCNRWNSAVFSSFPFVFYNRAIVTKEYLTNDRPWTTCLGANAGKLQKRAKTFTRISSIECARRYVDPLSGAGDVVVVTNLTNNGDAFDDGTSLLAYYDTMRPDRDWRTLSSWVCSSITDLIIHSWLPGRCTKIISSHIFFNWSVSANRTQEYVTVEYCLSEGIMDMSEKCGLHLNSTIMFVVCAMNVVKCLSILFTLLTSIRQTKQEYLVTIGDGIASFLMRVDPHTKGFCLQGWRYFEKRSWLRNPVEWNGPQAIRKFRASSWTSWITTLSW